jgi:hypothetical protein
MRVNTLEHEREHAGLLTRGADEPDAGQRADQLGGPGEQLAFPRPDRPETH